MALVGFKTTMLET